MNNRSKNTDNSEEEIDIILLLSYFERKLKSLARYIGRFFKFIFDAVIYSIKAVFDNYKIIVGAMLVAAVLGYFVENKKPPEYVSSMLVKPYFATKYQLITNISYYNALLNDSDHSTLADIFELNVEDMEHLVYFEIEPGPETDNERFKRYDKFIRTVDTTRKDYVSYDDFVANRDIFSSDLYIISVVSRQRDVFKKVEDGFNRTFENDYSKKQMMKRDSMIILKKRNFLNSLKEIDSLKSTYLDVIEKESETSELAVSLGDGLVPIQQKTKTREYELLEKELALKDSIRSLDQQRIEEDVFFDVISGFQKIGNIKKRWFDRYTFLFPLVTFFFLALFYITFKLNKFVQNYEG